MKTSDTHSYHGITLRNDAYGWVIQIKLMGKYRMLRSHADNPETAARRHDVALSKLEAFAEPTATPNFPEDFEKVSISRSAQQKSDGGLAFFDDLLALFSALCKEAEAAGMDPIEMAKTRRDISVSRLHALNQQTDFARVKLKHLLFKAQRMLPSCRLSQDKSKQLADLLDQTKRVLDLAS